MIDYTEFEARIEYLRAEVAKCDVEKGDMLRAFWAILDGALKHNDGAPLWANSTTTAFEALVEVAHDYAPEVAQEFQERLEG